ncbi:hypothetical protein L3X38_028232 [Prunus dulcis]|uniref:Uncharacterized protein n=1 Tax=Prunus dulcis TaxID=3755 RepID=A0AAD4VPD8_PRUDU|nr:hypothetical protein L3X38_028232 [Prunus dulcis]
MKGGISEEVLGMKNCKVSPSSGNPIELGNNACEAIAAIRRGMVLFRRGDVSGCVAEFDKAIELDPRQQRFGEGAEQSIWSNLRC